MTAVTTTAVLERTLDILTTDGIPDATVDRFVAGPNLVQVTYGLANGDRLAGVAHAPASDSDHTDVEGFDYPDIEGLAPRAVVKPGLDPDASPEDRAVAVATLNALSVGRVPWESGDPMEAVAPGVDTIGMVGMFVPAFGKFEDVDIRVVERSPEALSPPEDLPDGVSVELYGPDGAATAFENASVIFITGSTLVYGGIGEYLSVAPDGATVVLIGSSASFVPTVLFEAGVDLVAGATVTDVDGVARLIAEGATVPELHDNGLQKGIVRNDRSTSLSGLDRA
jgi:hypothetical protein